MPTKSAASLSIPANTLLRDQGLAPAAAARDTSHMRADPPSQVQGEPKILFIDQSGQLGGAEICLLPLAVRCTPRSEVLLLSDGPFRDRLRAEGVTVSVESDARIQGIKKERMKFGTLAALPGILRQVRMIAERAKPFDMVFLNTQKALILGAFSRALHGKPTVWHVHDIVSREHFGRLHLTLIKWAVKVGVDHVVANSRASADALIKLTGLPRSAVPVVHNGVDMTRFGDDASQASAVIEQRRTALGLPRDAFLVGLFGRFTQWKGQHVAIDAIARVPDAHLVLVGDALFGETAYAQGLRTQAEALGITDRVHFAGFQHDVASWMKAMDVIVHASTQPEPFGLVIIEAMAAGKPVIASNGGAVPEIVRHGENGMIIEPGDASKLAVAISTLQREPEMAKRIAAQGHADAGQHFSIDRYLQQMTRVLFDIATLASRNDAPESTNVIENAPASEAGLTR
ncbi:lipopolysaccharide biosynthesis protein [Burkholderia sp. PAMC 28687]|uniref:glycosyltransferase family 4 protein n=1 Tax=Burkholderia sp. PAMC 28687 TaxID=1795874 RepID=UPI0007862DAF|nr:glycosyltransferase family 4 protein [Burkholderia sp. PAMC 28687]AMM14140.1 lipopolysaccharide biosynthesis protein [Burkholderia sp. PAMC 28687]